MRGCVVRVLVVTVLVALAAAAAVAGGIRALAERSGVELGQPLKFYSQLDGVPTSEVKSYAWDFGDGGTSKEPNPEYTFKDEGTYSVTITVTLTDGKKLSDTITVQAAKACNC